jgi:hypothetical protein
VASVWTSVSARVATASRTASTGSSATPSPASAELRMAAFDRIVISGGLTESSAITSSAAALVPEPSSRTSQVSSPSRPGQARPGLATRTNSFG